MDDAQAVAYYRLVAAVVTPGAPRMAGPAEHIDRGLSVVAYSLLDCPVAAARNYQDCLAGSCDVYQVEILDYYATRIRPPCSYRAETRR